MDPKVISLISVLASVAISSVSAAYACSAALSLISSTAAMYSQKSSTLVTTYISATLATTIFLYAMIFNIKNIFNLEKILDLKIAFKKLGASIVYSLSAIYCGNGMGVVIREGMRVLTKKREFFLVLFIMLTILEICVLFSMLICFMN